MTTPPAALAIAPHLYAGKPCVLCHDRRSTDCGMRCIGTARGACGMPLRAEADLPRRQCAECRVETDHGGPIDRIGDPGGNVRLAVAIVTEALQSARNENAFSLKWLRDGLWRSVWGEIVGHVIPREAFGEQLDAIELELRKRKIKIIPSDRELIRARLAVINRLLAAHRRQPGGPADRRRGPRPIGARLMRGREHTAAVVNAADRDR